MSAEEKFNLSAFLRIILYVALNTRIQVELKGNN